MADIRNRESITRTFRRNAAGMIAASFAAMLGIIVDGVITGRYLGQDCMAAYGLATPVVNLIMVFSGVFSTGSQIVCAKKIGEEDNQGARRVFSMCMLATAVLSLILMAGLIFFRDFICIRLGASGDSAVLYPLLSDYLLGMVFSIPSVLLLFEFNGLMRLDNDPNRIMIAVGVMTAMDIAGDLLNVFVFRGGMLGMGLSTSVSYTAALVIMLFHFRRKDRLFGFSFKGLKIADLAEMVTAGSSSAVGSLSAMLRNRNLNSIMLATAASVTATAALSVLNTVLNFTSCTMIGVGLACSMMAGIVHGRGDRREAEELVKVSFRYSLIVGGILMALLLVFAGPVADFFGGEDGREMAAAAARGMRIYAAGLILYAVNTTFINYTQGMRRIAISNVFCFLENFVFVVIPARLMAGRLDSDAVWIAFVCTEVLTVISVFVFVWINRRHLPLHARDYVFMKQES